MNMHSLRPLKPYVTETRCLVIPSNKFHDDRGSFIEHYRDSVFSKTIIDILKDSYLFAEDLDFDEFVQDNISFSKKNVVRGLHLQVGERQQGKLVSVVNGEALDMVVDMRKESKTFGQPEFFQLLPLQNSIYIPPGFAHGFLAKEDNTIFIYKCTNEYCPSQERGINPLDEILCAPWLAFKDELIIAPKDRALPLFEDWEGD